MQYLGAVQMSRGDSREDAVEMDSMSSRQLLLEAISLLLAYRARML